MEIVLMGSIFGFSLLTLISYLLIVLNIDYLIIPISLLLFALCLKVLVKTIKTTKFKFTVRSLIVMIVFGIGIIGQMAIIAPSGTYKDGNLVFWSSHGHDGMWHIALMNEIKSGYPFRMPIFAGEKLSNYHFFSDILPAIVSKYMKISDLDLYFRIFPFYYSLALGASVFFLTKKITNNFNASIWATIFTYFAGSFGYLIGRDEAVFWSTQPQSSSGNPPQIISNFLLLAGIYFVLKYLEQKQKISKTKYFLISFIILGTISSFKIYAGFVILGTLAIIGTWKLIRNHDFKLFWLGLSSGIMALALYLPNAKNTGSFLIFEPWWYIRTMIVEPSRLNLLEWELKRQTYIYERNWKRVIWLEGIGFLIFFLGNLGMRFLGLWEFIKSNAIFKVAIVISIAMPLLFLQKGVATNTSQFLQYFILLFGILAGIGTAKLLEKIKKSIFQLLVSVFLFSLMIPTQITLLKDFYGTFDKPRPAFAKINSHELEALEFIKNSTNKNSVILTPPYNQNYIGQENIPNIWDWFDTAYVSAISSRRTYFDGYEQVDIMGYDFKERKENKIKIFNSSKEYEVKQILDQIKIDLIYFPKELAPKIDLQRIGYAKIFENDFTEIWRTN